MVKSGKTGKKSLRPLTEIEVAKLRPCPKQHRVYVTELDGCFGGYCRGPDCDLCLSRVRCNVLTNHRMRMRSALFGYGWRFREVEG